MRGDHEPGGLGVACLVHYLDAFLAQLCQHGVIVNQVTENSQRLLIRLGQCQLDGVPHAEAHAEVFGFKNLHNSRTAFAL